jgi:predicted P-loop ATPase
MNASEFFAVFGKQSTRIRQIGGGRAKCDWSDDFVQSDGSDVYFVVNDGGDKASDITLCRAFFVEWDDREIAWQLNAWRDLKLPEPTLQVLTGGKSVHNYWVLDTPCTVPQWKNIQARLIEYCDSDRALKDPSRVMRVPGFKHSKTGKAAEVVHSSDVHVNLRELDAFLPLISKKAIIRRVSGTESGTMTEILEAFECIPARGGNGTSTYPMYRNIAWGLAAACVDAGDTREKAVELIEAAEWLDFDARHVIDYNSNGVTAATFWYWAYQNGYQRPLRLPQGVQEAKKPWLERLGWVAPEPGKPVAVSPLQLCTVLESVGDAIRWNRLSNHIHIDGRELEDIDMQHMYIDIERCGVKIKKEIMTDALIRTARQNQFHPVYEYLEACDVPVPDEIWNNIAEELLASGADDFDNLMLRKWLIFAVARIYDPGCAFGTVHILSGEGMGGKSRFFMDLAGGRQHFLEGFEPGANEKDDAMKLHSRWICEWGELDGGIALRANTRLKNMLSTREDNFRAPYGKSVGNYPRQFVICGTTNKSTGFFTDETGNRRYVVFHVKDPINHDKVVALRDGVWAAAKRDYLNGVTWWPSQDEMRMSEKRNKELFTEDPWRDVVKAGAEVQHRVSGYVITSHILDRSLSIPLERQGQREQTRVNRLMKSLGYYQTRKQTADGFQSVWRLSNS